MKELEILTAFSGLDDLRGNNGKQHEQTLCIAIFTLAVVAGCRGLNAMGDWVRGNFSITAGALPDWDAGS